MTYNVFGETLSLPQSINCLFLGRQNVANFVFFLVIFLLIIILGIVTADENFEVLLTEFFLLHYLKHN